MSEKDILQQPLSEEEMGDVAGGFDVECKDLTVTQTTSLDSDTSNCSQCYSRSIYGGNGFANCAATVEDGSWCSSNDACFADSVKYLNMKDCSKAWK